MPTPPKKMPLLFVITGGTDSEGSEELSKLIDGLILKPFKEKDIQAVLEATQEEKGQVA